VSLRHREERLPLRLEIAQGEETEIEIRGSAVGMSALPPSQHLGRVEIVQELANGVFPPSLADGKRGPEAGCFRPPGTPGEVRILRALTTLP